MSCPVVGHVFGRHPSWPSAHVGDEAPDDARRFVLIDCFTADEDAHQGAGVTTQLTNFEARRDQSALNPLPTSAVTK